MDAPSTVRDADGGSQGEAGASSGAWQRRHVPSLLVGLAWLLIIGSGLALHLAADAGGRHRWVLPHTTPRLPSRRRLQQQLPKPGTFGGPGSCEESGMCSLGKLGVYVGEIDSTKGLKAALQAASYKNEVFLVVFGTINPEMAMNFAAEMWRVGLGNLMLMGANEAACSPVKTHFPNVTCVWSDAEWFPKNVVGESTDQWIRRYMVMARALRLGYNFFVMDTDAGFFTDPYKYLKAPPLRDIQFLGMRDGAGYINGGTNYVHNAAPDGPAAWVIWATVDRQLRVIESWDSFFVKQLKLHPSGLGGAVMDQTVINDIFATMKLGVPIIKYTMYDALNAQQKKLQDDLASWDNPHNVQHPELRWPEEWLWLTGGPTSSPNSINMTIPYMGGAWDERVAGKRFPPRGNYSTAFLKRVREESGKPFWGDYEKDRRPAKVPKNETFAFFPVWMIGFYGTKGSSGWWDVEPAGQVAFHIVALSGPAPLQHKKEAVLKAHHHYHYDVIAKLNNGRLFPSSSDAQPLPRVLALAPGLRMLLMTENDYRDVVVQLIQVALRLNRVLALPEPYCDSEWVGKKIDKWNIRGHFRENYNDWKVITTGVDDKTHCIWWASVDKRCMTAYLIHPDFEELLCRLPAEAATPSSKNTLWHDLYSPALALTAKRWDAQGGNPQPDAALSVAVDGDKLLAAAKPFASAHVLYLGALPRLTSELPEGTPEEQAAYQNFKRACEWPRMAFKPEPAK